MGCVHYWYRATSQTSESDCIPAPSVLVPFWFFTWNLLFTTVLKKNPASQGSIIGIQCILMWKLNLSYQFRWYLTDVEYCCASIHNLKYLSVPQLVSSLLHPEEFWCNFRTVGKATRCIAFGVVWTCTRFPLHKENNSIYLTVFVLLSIIVKS